MPRIGLEIYEIKGVKFDSVETNIKIACLKPTKV